MMESEREVFEAFAWGWGGGEEMDTKHALASPRSFPILCNRSCFAGLPTKTEQKSAKAECVAADFSNKVCKSFDSAPASAASPTLGQGRFTRPKPGKT